MLPGGTAVGTTLTNAAGDEIVSAGGTDIGAVISAGTQYAYGVASSATVFGGGSQIIESGGTASNTTINAAVETISAGGTDIGAIISGTAGVDGGQQFVYGTARAVTVDLGVQWVSSGGVASGTVVRYAAQEVLSGGTAIGTTLIPASGTGPPGLYEVISAGGSDIGARISAGTQYDYGFVSNATVFSASQIIESGGSA